MVTVPFYAFVKDIAKSNNTDTIVFYDQPLLIFAMYNAANGLNFVYEFNGQIKSVTGAEILFSHLEGEKQDKVVVLISQTAFAIPKKEAIAKGYMQEEEEIIEEEVEDEEVDEDKPSPDKGQKPKQAVRKSRKKK